MSMIIYSSYVRQPNLYFKKILNKRAKNLIEKQYPNNEKRIK